jgi:hypothetical protein
MRWPAVGERRQMQQRLRECRRDREARLLDLGALVYELHRQGKRAPELLQSKAAELELIDSEVRELEAQLSGEPAPAPPPAEEEGEADTQEADALEPEEEHAE